MLTALVGTSGWQYADWRGAFYPPEHPQRCWLEDYGATFPTVEVNNAFYRLPERSTFASWHERTPADFVVALKASRYLTHIRRLQMPAEPVARLVDRASALGPKLGPVLLQLPPTLPANLEALDETLSAFPDSIKVAVEPRHASWWTDGSAELLNRHDAAFCIADSTHGRSPKWRTASWGYLRFHEGRAMPRPCYGRSALAGWADQVATMYGDAEVVYAYFNNDQHACAPRNAASFVRALCAVGVLANPGYDPIRRSSLACAH